MRPLPSASMRQRLRTWLGPSLLTIATVSLAGSASGADPDRAVDKIRTASPIKHVIIIVGENRSFDHVFATYKPKNNGETIANLLSRKIINADGSPGPNFARAHQFRITAPPNGDQYFISASKSQKLLYQTLPPPDLAGTPPVSALSFILSIPGGDPGLPPQDQFLFGSGGTGLSTTLGPDIRIANVNAVPPGPFQMTGETMPYDAFTGDTIHQFFQMYQQMDCAIDKEHVTPGNPTGCLHDLQSAITTTYATAPGMTPHDTGQTMAFFNVHEGDAPFLKFLADTYTISDNYHQPVMGGTGPDSVPLGFADQVFFSDGQGKPATPLTSSIYNPDPDTTAYSSGNFNLYKHRAQWFNCSNRTRSPACRQSSHISTRYLTRYPPSATRTTSTPPSTLIRRSIPTARQLARAASRPSQCAASETLLTISRSPGSITVVATISRSPATRSTDTATSAIRSNTSSTTLLCGPTICVM